MDRQLDAVVGTDTQRGGNKVVNLLGLYNILLGLSMLMTCRPDISLDTTPASMSH